MEKLNHIVELVTGEHGLLSIFSFLAVTIFHAYREKKDREPEFLGDNAPYTLIDGLNRRGGLR